MGTDPFEVVDVDVDLVRSLLHAQHPDLADLPIELVGRGWDNATFRLGDQLAVRLPIRGLCAHLVEHEQRWLPQLAQRLPLPTPVPVRTGAPGGTYAWPWSIVPWFPGRTWLAGPPADLLDAAERLGRFVAALGAPAPPDAPPNPYRGVPLAQRAEVTIEHLATLDVGDGVPDRPTLERCWADHLAATPYDGPPRWLHGDLHPLNLVVHEDRLAAVIDFGDVTAGDPANDLMAAWLLFDGPPRERFLAAAGADDPELRRRGRGWALAWGAACGANRQPHNQLRSFGLAAVARVVADWQRAP